MMQNNIGNNLKKVLNSLNKFMIKKLITIGQGSGNQRKFVRVVAYLKKIMQK